MILAVMNQKGGVAKTTTAVTFADISARAGLRVCLIDLDAQGNCSDSLGVAKVPGLYRMLIDGQPLESVAVQARDNLYMVASDKSTYQAEQIVSTANFREYALSNALDGYSFDLIILDCGPGAHVFQIAALVAAEYVIIPTQLADFSIAGVVEVESTLKSARKMAMAGCKVGGILPVMLNRAEDESHAQLANLQDNYGSLVLPPIPTDSRVKVANRRGQTLHEANPKTPALIGRKIGRSYVGGYIQAFKAFTQGV